MHPRAFQLLRGVSMQPFFAEPDDQGGGAPADPAPADPPADPVPADPADPPADPAPADPAPADPAAADPAAPEPHKRTDWRQGRMDKLTAQAREAQEAREAAEERARAAEERAAAYEALYGRPEGEPAPAAPATTAIRTNEQGERLYTQAELDAAARTQAETTRLNEKLESMFDAGAAAHGTDWATRVNAAGAAFGDQLKTRPDFWQAMTKLPNATDVYHQLAGDLDHLNEVLAMGPVDLGMELAKLSTAAAAKPKGAAVSRVPAPITPIEAVSESEVDLSTADMKTYAKTRDEQMAARHAARYR